MKTKKILGTIALAFAAAFAAPVNGETLTGDIVDVRVLGTNDMEHSFTAGEEIYIRVRMLVENHDAVRADEYGTSVTPLKWSFFETGTASTILNPPRLGLWIGDKPAYADYTYNGPEAWQKSEPLSTDDAGDATPPKNTKYRYFSDLYFVYTVKAGDMGFPIMLMNSAGTGPASMDDDKHGYYIQNVTDAYPAWILKNSNGTEAKFWYGDIDTMEEDWPTGISGDHALKNYDLSLSPAYVKTIDFDQYNAEGLPYSEGDIWRNVYIGMSTPPGLAPRLVLGGGTSSAATIVYVWSADETIAYPVASGDNTISIVDGKKVLRVSLPAGETSVPFLLEGAAGASENAETTIFMSPVATGNVTKPAGELVHVAVSRTIKAVTAPAPTITVYVNGDKAVDTVTADADYVTAKAQLAIKIAPASDEDVVVRLKAKVSGDDTLSTLDEIYADNILRIADGDYGGDPLGQMPETVTIPKNTSVVYQNIYILGGTSKTENKGVTFSLEKVSGPDAVTVKSGAACTLKVKRSTPVIETSDPEFAVGGVGGIVSVTSGASQDFALTISDSYRDINSAEGYTFHWECASEEDIDDQENITADTDGFFVGDTAFYALTDGADLKLQVKNSSGKSSAKVQYTLQVTDGKKTTITFEDGSLFKQVAEGQVDSIVLGLSQAYSRDSYIYIESNNAETFACVDSPLKTTPAKVDKGRMNTSAPSYQLEFLDGAKAPAGTNVTIKAVLYKAEAQTAANRLDSVYSPGQLSFSITNVPPRFKYLRVVGDKNPVYDTGNDGSEDRKDPIYQGAEKEFYLDIDDVAADMAASDVEMVKISIDNDDYCITNKPSDGPDVGKSVGQQMFKHKFEDSGTSTMLVWLKDKDMSDYPTNPDFTYNITVVARPGMTITTGAENDTYDETNKNASVTVTLGEMPSEDLTVRFTVPEAADGGYLRLRTTPGSVTNVLDGSGAPIPGVYDILFRGNVESNRTIKIEMDGTPDTEDYGLVLNASVVTDSQSGHGMKWSEFYKAASPLLAYVRNNEPKLNSVVFGGRRTAAGATNAVPLGVARTLSLTASDVDVDLTNGNFAVQWTISSDGDPYGTTYETHGHPTNAENVVTNTFTYGGLNVVEVRIKDKDMLDYPDNPDFMFYVNVIDRPEVRIEANNDTYLETDVGGDSWLRIRLSEDPKTNVTVHVKIAKSSDGGFMSINTNSYDYVTLTSETATELEYDVAFDSQHLERPLYAAEMDGTAGSFAGLSVSAEVTNVFVNVYGIALKDFYQKDAFTIHVLNAPPEIIYPTLQDEADTNRYVSVNSSYNIPYAGSDVPGDFSEEHPVTVVITLEDDVVLTTNVWDSEKRYWPVEFPSGGASVRRVRVTYTDKDHEQTRNGQSYREMEFHIRPAKDVRLSACGPKGSSSYGSASGLGAGRVYASIAGDFSAASGPQKVNAFTHFYSFDSKLLSFTLYAAGYKANEGADNGTLGSPDQKIDESGSWSKDMKFVDDDPPGTSEYYCYTNQHFYGQQGYDSFAYAVLNTTPNATDEPIFDLINLQIDGSGVAETPLELVESQDGGGSSYADPNDMVYPIKYWEVVFSREFLKSDNCGDINHDGIPDIVVYRREYADFNIFENGKLVKSDGAGDLTDLSGFNGDKDADGNDAPDFLPVKSDTAIYGQLIPGLSGTWVDTGEKFGAKKEIRGYADGLNDALAQLGLPVESDRIYAEEVDGKWKLTANCTIDDLELAAWKEYAAEHGLSWSNSTDWAQWSPERPTDPTKYDTDGDEFSDGYEYYFWYKAHVGYWDGNVHRRLTGRRYNPHNPGEGDLIPSAVIARLMDPRSDLSPVDELTDAETAKFRSLLSQAKDRTSDTDNDGLPDLLEFIIGTNPFDFDTDGDGLPDGWELMIAGLNPLLDVTSKDALNDAMRNYDGDAMAITSYALEQLESPKPVRPERCRFTTFAVIDADGDTDGAQWYTTTNSAETVSNMVDFTQTKSMYCFNLADGTLVAVDTDTKPAVEDGRLACTFYKDKAFKATKMKDGSIERGWPLYLQAGTLVNTSSVKDDPVDVIVPKLTDSIGAGGANALWIYGKGSGNASRGDIARTAASYGCLALGGPKAVPKDAEICAVPNETRDVALLHYQVYQQCGFDPRTAWSPRDPIAARWGKTVEGEGGESVIVEGVVESGGGNSNLQHPARTRDYRTYDEFLVYSFFVNSGCDMTGYIADTYSSAPYLARAWGACTTNPQGPDEPEKRQLEPSSDAMSAVGWSQYFFGTDSTNGADTDGDGVPDGWELYVMAGPKTRAGKFVFAPPYAGFRPTGASSEMEHSYFSPFLEYAKKTETLNKNYVGADGDDLLTEFQEFEGTDSIAWYSVVQDSATSPYSTTVAHSGEWTWFNKFFPTDPWSKDTDGDGIDDKKEGDNFAYGTPADNGKLTSIPGGGLNPNSVDTDLDGLPDPWEVQFKGKTQFPGDLPENIAEMGSKAKDADGNDIGNYLQGLIDGMDGTVIDAKNYPINVFLKLNDSDNVNQVVNRDYDRDGLDNWQEYFTGMMRCWRYDDPISPWIPIPDSAYTSGGVGNYDILKAWYEENKQQYPNSGGSGDEEMFEVSGDDLKYFDLFWSKTLVDKASIFYNPQLVSGVASCAQYLSRVTNVWDLAWSSTGTYYWFYDRVANQKIEEVWPLVNTTKVAGSPNPTRYACCSPIDPDSDHDGMDDYYELFHGMNPLLGMSGVTLDTGAPCDLVYYSWGPSSVLHMEAKDNFWRVTPEDMEDYDFVRWPWLNGMADADPDGDGNPNQAEALMPNLAAPADHTDPTPLWMTDSTYENSLVNRFYRMPVRYYDVLEHAQPDVRDVCTNTNHVRRNSFEKKESRMVGGVMTDVYDIHWFRDFDGWASLINTTDDGGVSTNEYFNTFWPDQWLVADRFVTSNWMFSFEENEGYDTDHDGTGDEDEQSGKVRGATDPQDADSPRRRQAMYFQGPARPSALQTMPRTAEDYPVGATGYQDDMAFRTFTVECWARPESLEDSVLVERAVWIERQNPADEEFIRKNFQLAIKNGLWCARFDPFSTRSDDSVEVFSSAPAADDVWTHLAATYDGETLVLYVNGVAAATKSSGLLPAYGSAAVAFLRNSNTYWFDLEFAYHAVIVGASAKTTVEGGIGYALNVENGVGWDAYTRFYKGWIDEVRIWDGARTAAEVAAARDVRFTAEMAATNRSEVASLWLAGHRRDEKESDGSVPSLPAELRYHWSFDSIFGAQNETALATAPAGFNSFRALASRPEDYEIAWWKAVHEGKEPQYLPAGLVNDPDHTEYRDNGTPGYENGAYRDMAWVPWIPNTVAHLPRYDGTTLDSMFWSLGYMGDESGAYSFADSAEPATIWTQMSYNGELASNGYDAPGSRHYFVSYETLVNGGYLSSLYNFTGRHLTKLGEDLVPLGGAYARTLDNDVGMWDGQGASSSWELTGSDSDGDGLPDWWENYAEGHYRGDLAPSVMIEWDTPVVRGGVTMSAGEAYLRDLAAGFYMNADGDVVNGSTLYEQIADGDFSGIPDWWEDLYGIAAESGLEDHDGDGLPNYVEYLLSEVFKFKGVAFDPTNPRSVDPYTPDYFFRVGSLYVGEMFTDHDFVYDLWEDSFRTLADGETGCASRYAYDPAADADEDGWSNLSESMAGTRPDMAGMLVLDDGTVQEFPVPLIRIKARYAGQAKIDAPLVVKAYPGNGGRGVAADATWTVAGDDSAVSHELLLGLNKGTTATVNLGPGSPVQGSVHVYFRDPSELNVSEDGKATTSDPLASSWRLGIREYTIDGDPLHTTLGGAGLLGGVDYGTGFATINFADVPRYLYHSNGTWSYSQPAESNAYVRVDTSRSYVKVTWQNQRISDEQGWNFVISKADDGHVREGRNTFTAFADLNGNGEFDDGEPYGVAQGVDVSWSGTTVELELTDASPITPRFDLWKAGAVQVAVTNIGETSEVAEGQHRIRVVRWQLDKTPVCSIKYGEYKMTQRVVLETMMNSGASRIITEADFLDEDTFDIDWESFYDEVVTNELCELWGIDNVKAQYLVMIDYNTDEKDEPVWKDDKQTNKWVTASQQIITRYYGKDRVLPEPALPEGMQPNSAGIGIVNTASPTFTWKIDCPDREGYTAFRIVVTNADGFVYDSGIRRAPPRAADKTYRWTAPLYVDDMIADGMVFSNKTVYSWSVAMYNSKFREEPAKTNSASFFMNVPTNTAACGTAPVRVRYFGPATNFEHKVVRVQAFRSPDFTGQPVAAGYVATNDLQDLAKTGTVFTVTNANCRVVGIPAGTYYLKAFIDSNTNGVCDVWESAGYFTAGYGMSSARLDPAPVSIGPTAGISDLVNIYIEDADTDNDGLPDAWEYAEFNGRDEKGVELLSEAPAGEVLVNTNLTGALEVKAQQTQSASSGLSVHALSVMRNAGTLALAMGAPTRGYDSFAAAISGSVSEELSDDGVTISSLEIVDGKVVIKVDTETESGVSSPLLSGGASHGPTVVAKVYWKQSLDDDWQLVETSDPFVAGGDAAEISIDRPDNASSGFYQVVVEPTTNR